jgi:hypothetical protein
MKNEKSLRVKKFYIKKSKEALTAASSKAVNRLELTTVRWGQDGWILDYLNEHIFGGLMRDFDKFEMDDDYEAFSISPVIWFEQYIEDVKISLLPTPITSIDLKQAKQFTKRPLSEKQLFNTIKKVGDYVFKGGLTLPVIENLDTKEKSQAHVPQDQPIYTWVMFEKQKPRGKKTVKHQNYYLVLTVLGIYLMLTASAFWNVDFLPKALYKLNHACNDFYRSIAGFWHNGRVKLSYLKVRERMGIRDEANPSKERERIEQNLDYLKDNGIIEDWIRVKGGKKYGKNEDIVYEITLSERNWKRRKNIAKRKAREEWLRKQAKLLTEQQLKDNEN